MSAKTLVLLCALLAVVLCDHTVFDSGSTGVKIGDEKVCALPITADSCSPPNGPMGLQHLIGPAGPTLKVGTCNPKTGDFKPLIGGSKEELAKVTTLDKLKAAGKAILESGKASNLWVWATAGMRQFNTKSQDQHNNFWKQLCGLTISGKEISCSTIHGVQEALLEFIAINTHDDGYGKSTTPAGTITMGGSSLQIAIPIPKSDKKLARTFDQFNHYIHNLPKVALKNTAPYHEDPVKLYAQMIIKPDSELCTNSKFFIKWKDPKTAPYCAEHPYTKKLWAYDTKTKTWGSKMLDRFEGYEGIILISFLAVETRSIVDDDPVHFVGGPEFFSKYVLSNIETHFGHCGGDEKSFSLDLCYAQIQAHMRSDPMYLYFLFFWSDNNLDLRQFDAGTRAADLQGSMSFALKEEDKKLLTIKVEQTSASKFCSDIYEQLSVTNDELGDLKKEQFAAQRACRKFLTNGVGGEPQDNICIQLVFKMSFYHDLFCGLTKDPRSAATKMFTTLGAAKDIGWSYGATSYLSK